MKLPRMSRKGNVAVVFAALVTIIGLMIGMLIYSKVSGSIDQTGFTADENTTMTNVRDYSLTAFGLLAVGIIVLGAVAIIAYLMKLRA